jgi:hypothetical protein
LAGPGQPQASSEAHGFFGVAQLAGGVELGAGLLGAELVGGVLLVAGLLVCAGLLVGGWLDLVGVAVGLVVGGWLVCRTGGRVGWKSGIGRSGMDWECQCQVDAPAAPLEASDSTSTPAPNSMANRRCLRTSSLTIGMLPSSRTPLAWASAIDADHSL